MTTNGGITGRDLIAYLDREVKSGQLNAGTASSRRSAVREVLNVAFGREWKETAFSSDEVVSLLNTFAEARGGDFTKESIRSYQSNFRRTVELSLGRAPKSSRDVEWITHRFPIRSGVVLELGLPVDLTAAEAERLSTFITALPVD